MINRRMTEFKLFIHPVNLLAENRRKRIGRMERKKEGKKERKERKEGRKKEILFILVHYTLHSTKCARSYLLHFLFGSVSPFADVTYR
jgi:hypothetical protein